MADPLDRTPKVSRDRLAHELQQQRISFAYGSLSIENDAITRASIYDGQNQPLGQSVRSSILRGSISTKPSNAERSQYDSVQGLMQQYDEIISIALETLKSGTRFKIDSNLIFKFQALAMKGDNSGKSGVRTSGMTIYGSVHLPPGPEKIQEEINRCCEYINDNFDTAPLLHLPAYALWQINRIHPFVDGNGRTARAICYLLLLLKSGGILPGHPTVPEQLSKNRQDYFAALELADESYNKDRSVDVSVLEVLLDRMVKLQISGDPAISNYASQMLDAVMQARFHSAANAVKHAISGTKDAAWRLWSVDDHLVLQVADAKEIEAAASRKSLHASTFPGLLAWASSNASIKVDFGRRNAFVVGASFDALTGGVFYLERDASLVCRQIRIASNGVEWSLKGTIYILKMGFFTTSENFYKSVDLLIARDSASVK